MKKNTVTYPLIIKIKDKIYQVAEISLDQTLGKENIYHTPKYKEMLNIGSDINNNKQAGSLDHFSIHTDGAAHATFKSINRAENHPRKLKLKHSVGFFPGGLIPKDLNTITPLIIDSIYSNNRSWNLPSKVKNPIKSP